MDRLSSLSFAKLGCKTSAIAMISALVPAYSGIWRTAFVRSSLTGVVEGLATFCERAGAMIWCDSLSVNLGI